MWMRPVPSGRVARSVFTMPSSLPSPGLRGPAYVRKLRGPPGARNLPVSRSIALVADGACPSLELIRHAIRTARRQRSNLWVLQVLGCEADESGPLRDTFDLGELLTTAVLRAGDGRLPPLVTILVHVGGPDTVIDLVTSAINPRLVLAEQALVHGRSSALPELIGSAQGCPVLLMPTSGELAGELPASIRLAESAGRLN